MRNLTVGFDLDMTLIDSRRGIAAVYRALARETGVDIDADAIVGRLGRPLEQELARWFEASDVPAMARRYRELYPDMAVSRTAPLPGVHAALEAVRRNGGRTLVVTAKHGRNARLDLDHLGIEVDELVGSLWGAAKGEALRAHGSTVYVGDHLGDVAGARAAEALSVGVASGPMSAAELRAGGADVVLGDLTEFPAWFEEFLLEQRLEALDRRLRELGSVVVAFSGGADSAFLLAAAVRALGADRVLAATAVSPSLPAAELEAAAALAERLGVRHVTPATREMARDGYRTNGRDRCYFCKAELVEVLTPIAAGRGRTGPPARVVTGTNADDVAIDGAAGFRPGIRAAAERGAVTPLFDAGLTKAQVREASRRIGLPTWDKPAAACLSSRIAYGLEITPHRLGRVERAEAALRRTLAAATIPVEHLRVRDLGDRARVEVDREAVPRVARHDAALAAVRDAGFAVVEVDPRGFRSGSMNEMGANPRRARARSGRPGGRPVHGPGRGD